MLDKQIFQEIIANFMPQAELANVWQMQGGVSAQVYALELNNPSQKLILRQESDMPSALELRLLQDLHNLGIPVPKVLHLDNSRKHLPKPFIIMEYIEGTADFSPKNPEKLLTIMAESLVKIHSISLSQHDFSYLPAYKPRVLWRIEQFSQSDLERRILAILNLMGKKLFRNTDVLLHGDYWAGNLLWNNGELRAVIDWEDAALGEPLIDMSNARLEILWAYGEEAMQIFSQAYQAQMPQLDFSLLPYWDLYAALRPLNQLETWGLPEEQTARMKTQAAWFIEKAIEQIQVI